MAATYQAIAAALRQRIESGQLRAGDRVPSTRQITREWGVAIATATKALAVLQSEGLVRSMVGVGTVVADRPQGTDVPRARAAVELSRESVVRTAIAIADAEGIAALTMRRLATELDVAVMSLYRHVRNKEDLIVLMADVAFGEASLPDPPPAHWRSQLEILCREQWALIKRHPWVPGVMSLSRPLMVPNGMAQTDASMQALRQHGVDPVMSLYVTVALAGLLIGTGATLQIEADAERDTGMTSEEWMNTTEDEYERIGAPTRFPALTEVSMIPGFDLDLDTVYDVGVALMLDGLAQRIPAQPPQKRVRSSRSMPRRAS